MRLLSLFKLDNQDNIFYVISRTSIVILILILVWSDLIFVCYKKPMNNIEFKNNV